MDAKTIIAAFLTLLQGVVGTSTTNDTISKVITALIDLIPAIVQEVSDLLPIVKNIIATMRGSSVVTADQLDQLDTLEKQIDDAFDAAAAKAAQEEDAAALPTTTK